MCATQQGRPEETLRTAQEAFGGAVNSLATESPRCMCCHRPLSDPVSVSRGFGRVCGRRLRLDERAAMVAIVRLRIDQLSTTVDVLDADQLESVDAALADLLAALRVIA